MNSHTVHAAGLDLHYLEAGDGPPVLFLHGWPTNAQLWRHVLPVVGRTHRAIALDLPGFGRSDKPSDASYSFRYMDHVLDAFLDALGIDETGLVVHDLGGPLGLHWASTRIPRIRELVLLNTLVFPTLHWSVIGFLLATRTPGLRSLFTSSWGLKQTMRFGVTDKSRITDEVAALYQQPFPDRRTRKVLLKTLQVNPKGFDTIAGALPGFRCPTLLLYGENDWILPDIAHTMQRVKQLIPQADLSSIPHCGHFLQEDQPDEVAERLGAFFKGDRPTMGS